MTTLLQDQTGLREIAWILAALVCAIGTFVFFFHYVITHPVEPPRTLWDEPHDDISDPTEPDFV